MRPEILFSLFGDVARLPGVGPRTRDHFARLAGRGADGARVVDLLWHLPTGLIDRRWRPSIEELKDGAMATLDVRVAKHIKAPNKRAPYRVECFDDSGKITLVFFHAHEKYLRAQLPEGEARIISGRVERFGANLQMSHPDFIVKPEDAESLPLLQPIYPLTQGISQKILLKAITAALEGLPDLPEWQRGDWLGQQKWRSWKDSLLLAHHPQGQEELEPTSPARARLAYDELFANQLAVFLVRRSTRRKRGRALLGNGVLRQHALELLPYDLTLDQRAALAEIDDDLASDTAMLRLMQGDVGSGKTIVAFLAALRAIESGTQAAILAPTEILARQHRDGLSELCDKLGINMCFLAGRHKGKARQEKLTAIKSGEIDLIIGTHALFQEGVDYHDLGLAVVDEQHRFGVYQRLAIAAKGKTQPDMLVMTATPIPRTLSLTIYGDMDVSVIREKPPGRQPIKTNVISLSRLDEVASGLGRALGKGERVYWVCPLVEESEKLDLAAAEERYAHLQQMYGDDVGLVHGRMKAAEKDAVMADFQAGKHKILVATTVIEVGVDVAEATIMVIEHAERFGLAQLHQLRGRVGRGDRPSSCVLLRDDNPGDVARARLRIMRETDDGFIIAEEDLRLRGAGEVLGTRQSGLPIFRVADLAIHADLLAAARDDAKLYLEEDPDMKSDRAAAIRILLYLFEREEGVRLLSSG